MQLIITLFCLSITYVYGSEIVNANDADDGYNTPLTPMQEQIDNLQAMVLSLSETTKKQEIFMEELQEEFVRKDQLIQQLREQVDSQEHSIQQLRERVESRDRQLNERIERAKVFESGNHSETRSTPQGVKDFDSFDEINERLNPRETPGASSGSVAFSAYVTHNLYNLGPNAIIPFQGVVLNEGNAYNSNVGVFTAPRDGLYFFSFALEDMETHILSVRLVVDGKLTTSAVVRPSIPGIMAFNLVIVRLTVGESVWVAIDPSSQNNSIQGNPDARVSTFSGAYLH